MVYVASDEVLEVSFILKGISNDKFDSHEKIKEVCKNALVSCDINVLDHVDKVFTPIGYSINFLLSESHFSLHTYPEYSSMVCHLSSCDVNKNVDKLLSNLKDFFEPKDVETRKEIFKIV